MIGSNLKHFQITDALGAGGMGEVWRARDTKLEREVAVKLLPEAVAKDPDRLSRFQREARTLASLNHPNIASIYGLEDADDRMLLILELVEGEGLDQRIARGPVPIDEALGIARQIAEALEAAHGQGIVHRDLKPANVKITPGGRVKVLDFGLAKAFEPATDAPDLTRSPTLTAHMTAAGVVLGTAAYMSPEQARGVEVDKRADIWAFGCVLYEMLAGQQPFRGGTVSDVLASILKESPDSSALPANTPRRLRRLLDRCLTKDRRQRLHDIADARIEIDEILEGGGAIEAPVEGAVGGGRGLRIWQAVAALFLLTTVAAAWLALRPDALPREVVRAFIPPAADTSFSLDPSGPGVVAISPDGQNLAFAASDSSGAVLLWVRRIGDLTARPLPGTEDAAYPFWSSDSRYVGYFSNERLRKIDAAGGPPVTICEAENGKGGSWSEDGQILFAPAHNTPIHLVSAAGGDPRPVTELSEGIVGHRFPVWLPDGRFLYLARATSGAESDRIVVGSMDAVTTGREVLAAASNVAVASGRLLFVREGILMAQPFDVDRAEVTGDAVPVAEDVLYMGGARWGVFSASQTGRLTYLTGAVQRESEMVWVDRTGRLVAQLGAGVLHRDVKLSPDGLFAAAEVIDETNGTSDIWIYDVRRGLRTRFTFDASMDWWPTWSPDGSRIAFASDRSGSNAMYIKTVGGSDDETVVLEDPDRNFGPDSWSPDGRWLVHISLSASEKSDLWALNMETGERLAVAATSFAESNPAVSPDGRWLAFVSNESGAEEVYVTSFPQPARRWQVSTGGGDFPRWRGDGSELFFRRPDGTLVAAEVDGSGDGFVVGKMAELFRWDRPPGFRWPYDVDQSGERFLINRGVASTDSAPLTLVLNWDVELEPQGR
jgi:Tol biopolymer transport system component